ncbi:MAG: hypothetical protein S4CHLAM7_08000 [Chlamydiae bacterium]|nr:hypothetical protein [Chlamydiota bacterium]
MGNSKTKNIFCRICGRLQSDPPWGEDGKTPSYDICDCCGVEFGYQDCIIEGIRKYRKKWIEKGCIWDSPENKPLNWSLEDQLKNISNEFL